MMMNPFTELFLILLNLYSMVVLLRFFMQHFRVDFYNPFSQFVVKITDPLVRPLRKILPGLAGIDLSTLLLAYALGLLQMLIEMQARGMLGAIGPVFALAQSLFNLLYAAISLFTYLILIRVILSWVAPGGYNPVAMVFFQLTEPLLRPFRRLLPDTGGLDLSPLLAGLGLFFLGRIVAYYLQPLISALN